MHLLFQDLRYGLRSLLRTPGASVFAIIALALGIGANSAVFSIVNAVLIRPLPYPNSERLVAVWEDKINQGAVIRAWLSPADYRDFRESNQVFDQMGAFRAQSSVLAGHDLPERVEAAAVSAGIFGLLGTKPVLGRVFAADEDQPGKNSVVVLSDGLWRRRFGASPNILGSTLDLDGASYQVIGVAPPGFRLPDSRSEIWVPYTPEPKELARRGLRTLTVIARLKRGVTPKQAEIGLQTIARNIAEIHPDSNAGYSAVLVPLNEQIVGDIRPTLWTLMGAVAFILLIACVNVANLLLARASSREKEMAVRTSLGASPGKIVRQLLTESTLLALIGGAAGLLLAEWAISFVVKLAPSGIPRVDEISLDWRVLMFTLAVSALTGLVFGLAPALESSRVDLNSLLKTSGRSASGHRGRSRMRNALVVCEMASCLALLICAGLLVRSLMHLGQVNPGFRADHVLTMQISLPRSRYSGLKTEQFYKQLLDRVNTLPGVQSAGICRFLPLSGNDASANFQIEGEPVLSSADQPRAKFRAAGGEYFAALRIPLLRGRLFNATDGERTSKVVIINQAAARRFWPNQDPVGKRILSGFDQDQWSTIIGIVGNVKHSGLDAEINPETYYNYLQIPPEAVAVAEASMALVIRTNTAPLAMVSAVRNEVRGLDPDQPVFDVKTMEDVVYGSVAQPRFRSLLLSLFAGLALLLAGVGLYGVTAYSVTQRSNELGVRMALGAEPGQILKLVMSHAMLLASFGLVIGVAIAFACARMMEGLLFGVRATDPASFGISCLVLLSIAALASFIPAVRATRIDPISALRTE